MGQIDVLNVSQGHLRLKFDRANPIETEQARTAVQDMLRRGYMIFVEYEGGLQRVTDFDPATDEYILGNVPFGAPPATAAPANTGNAEVAGILPQGDSGGSVSGSEGVDTVEPGKRGRGRGRPRGGKRVAAGGARATAVARTSGG